MPRFPIGEWLANLVRVTAFPVAPLAPPDERHWWLPVVGTEPEARSIKPRAGILEESGPLAAPGLPTGGVRFVLASSPTRIDWQISPMVTPAPELDFVGSLAVALPALLGLVSRWLELTDIAPPLRRLAVGGTAMIEVPNRETGYRSLVDYLPALNIDATGSAELFYQINRPRESTTVPGLRLNRLSKWQVSSVQMLPLGDQIAPSASLAFVTVELDINTAAERSEPIPQAGRSQLLQELTRLGLEVADKGDVA